MEGIADLRRLAVPGAEIAVRVTPRARHDAVLEGPDGIALRVTAPPADGATNAAARRVLAQALGVAPSRLVLVAGAAARIKRFRVG
ncbi:MAG: DUF167 domain-containing protein [Gemmobacter sp.]